MYGYLLCPRYCPTRLPERTDDARRESWFKHAAERGYTESFVFDQRVRSYHTAKRRIHLLNPLTVI